MKKVLFKIILPVIGIAICYGRVSFGNTSDVPVAGSKKLRYQWKYRNIGTELYYRRYHSCCKDSSYCAEFVSIVMKHFWTKSPKVEI